MGESRAARDRAAPGASREDAGSAAPPCTSLSIARLRRAETVVMHDYNRQSMAISFAHVREASTPQWFP
jgi:hypothetical protein